MLPVHAKTIDEVRSSNDAYRVLVDRLWPGGISKEYTKIDEWLKDAPPSQSLRKWSGHQPEKWELFSRRYAARLWHHLKA